MPLSNFSPTATDDGTLIFTGRNLANRRQHLLDPPLLLCSSFSHSAAPTPFLIQICRRACDELTGEDPNQQSAEPEPFDLLRALPTNEFFATFLRRFSLFHNNRPDWKNNKLSAFIEPRELFQVLVRRSYVDSPFQPFEIIIILHRRKKNRGAD